MSVAVRLVAPAAGDEAPAGAAADVEMSEAVFGRAFNEPLVHQAVVAYLSGGRQGTSAQKTRAEVRGGGRKPWRQKGSGRARAGSTSSPLWRGGGRAFAAKPRDHAVKVNRKMYRGALRCILSELVRRGRLIAIASDFLALDAPKTKALAAKLAALNVADALIVVVEVERNLYLAARNLPGVEVCDVEAVNPLALVGHETVLIAADALQAVEERLA